MAAMRVERAEARPWARSASTAWNAFDVQLAFYAFALAVVGLLIAYTNSGGAALAPGSTFTRGLMWFAIAIVIFTIAAAFEYRWLRTFAWLLYAVNIGLLAMTLAVGTGVGGVSRWVTLPVLGLQFQFSELAKVLMIGVLAAYMASHEKSVGRLATMVGAGLLVAPPLALVLVQPDLGTSLVFGAILLGVLFISGASLRWLLAGLIALAAVLPFVWSYVLQPYQQRRLLSFMDPTADPQGSGYQVIQSTIAVGSGGLFGKGLTNSTQGGLNYLPEQATDFAAAVLLEELGFVGGVVMFVLFAALIWRILVVGWRSDDLFGVAFAGGVASMILFQLLVNVGMTLGVMPVTGIPLPFVTHGGASLISMALALGLLQSINIRRNRPSW